MHLRPLLAAALLALAGCAGLGNAPPPGLPLDRAMAKPHTGSSPIQHVVFIIQENRSFNNMFMGFRGAKTKKYGFDDQGNKIALHSQDLATNWDIDHSSAGFFAACDGRGTLPGTKCKMDGWNHEQASYGHPANFAYAYVTQSQIEPYWVMAKQYVLADHMFPSNLDGSFISHQYAVAAFASSGVDYPSSNWGCEGGSRDTVATLTAQRQYGPHIVVCFDNPTIASEADSAGVSWRFYAGSPDGDGGLWTAYQADSAIYNGPDWNADVISPPSKFLSDVGAGNLAQITWITPTYENSDHAGFDADGGPAWVTSVVNAIGESKFWNSTAIFIMWDDPGGWFDPVKPVLKDYDGLGFRVPLIVISPYAKRGYVTHVQYETASVLRFMEDNFGLGQLAASDARAHDPAGDALDYTQKPRAFKKIQGSKPTAYWVRRDRAFAHLRPPKSIIGSD
ncbi:MAG TPA: alkaline phosphatase family protein [Candidatus Tumulicola sp.]|jgi:phospholipase C